MARSTSTIQRRDALVRRFLPLVDALARRHHNRFSDLLERDDLIQVARLALVQAAARITEERTAPAYLKRCITGALAHHLRDRSRLVRLPARRQSSWPWRHLSLDAPCRQGDSADDSDDACLCPLDLLPAPPSNPAQTADSGLVQQLLGLLPPRQAAAIRLTVLDGLSLREAAKSLGVSAASLCRARQEALEELRQLLGATPPLPA